MRPQADLANEVRMSPLDLEVEDPMRTGDVGDRDDPRLAPFRA